MAFISVAENSYLTPEQVALLLKPIHPQRVLQLKGMSYVEGYDIRAELNRVFGFARWSEEIQDQHLICETEVKTNAGKPAWNVVYYSRVALTVNAPDGTPLARYEGAHAGENTHPVRGEAHAIALTASQTYALRRAAINLGDQFGLGLYNKGSLDPIVRWTLVGSAPADTDDVARVEAADEAAIAQAEAADAEFTPAPAESKPVPSSPRPARKRTPPAAEPAPVTVESLVKDIIAAQTVEVLRQAWMDAGSAGLLKSEAIIDKDTGEKTLIEQLLHSRFGQLAPAKSNGDGAEHPAESKDAAPAKVAG